MGLYCGKKWGYIAVILTLVNRCLHLPHNVPKMSDGDIALKLEDANMNAITKTKTLSVSLGNKK